MCVWREVGVVVLEMRRPYCVNVVCGSMANTVTGRWWIAGEVCDVPRPMRGHHKGEILPCRAAAQPFSCLGAKFFFCQSVGISCFCKTPSGCHFVVVMFALRRELSLGNTRCNQNFSSQGPTQGHPKVTDLYVCIWKWWMFPALANLDDRRLGYFQMKGWSLDFEKVSFSEKGASTNFAFAFCQ